MILNAKVRAQDAILLCNVYMRLVKTVVRTYAIRLHHR